MALGGARQDWPQGEEIRSLWGGIILQADTTKTLYDDIRWKSTHISTIEEPNRVSIRYSSDE